MPCKQLLSLRESLIRRMLKPQLSGAQPCPYDNGNRATSLYVDELGGCDCSTNQIR